MIKNFFFLYSIKKNKEENTRLPLSFTLLKIMISLVSKTTNGVDQHCFNKTPFNIDNKDILERHYYMTGLKIKYIHLENIPVAFFYLVKETCGIGTVHEISKRLNTPITYELSFPETENMHENLTTITSFLTDDFRNPECSAYFKSRCNEIIDSSTLNYESMWVEIWKGLEVICQKYDVMNILSYFIVTNQIITYLFEFENENENEYFLMARLLETFANYLGKITPYRKVSTRFNLGHSLQFLYNGRQGLQIPHPLDQDSIKTIEFFVVNGVFKQFSNQQASTLPFSRHPEDGLILRFILGIYLLSFIVNEPLAIELRKFVHSAYQQLLSLYIELIQLVNDAGIKPNHILNIRDVETMFPVFKLNFEKMSLIFKCDIISQCFSYILKYHIEPKINQKQTEL